LGGSELGRCDAGKKREERKGKKRERKERTQLVFILERFFLDYKVLEDKEVEVEGFQGVAEAQRALREAIEFYARQFAEKRGTEPG
jgi:inorganic pyrophosphatase